MDVTVLFVPGCPNLGLLERRLAEALGGRTDVTMTRLAVIDEQDAVRTGMRGSPTLLVDGQDPFAATDAPASLSCRLYPDSDGPARGVPSVRALRRVLLPSAPGLAPPRDPALARGSGPRAPGPC